jgi:hypothetical protein
MCTTFYTKTGKSIDSVEKFEESFNVDAEKYSKYDDLVRDACLCQIDVYSFLRDRADIRERFMQETSMDFYEK